MTVTQEIINGLYVYVLDNGTLRLVALPQLGGKIISLCRMENRNEWLMPWPHPAQPPRMPKYAEGFEEYGASGFDECFPTVASCLYPQPRRAPLLIPDHGELWSSPWHVSRRDDAFVSTVSGTALPYLFSRSITFQDSTVRFHYELENIGSSAFQYLWSAHPLLRVFENDEIFLPDGVKRLRIEHSRSARLGHHGDMCAWPIAKTRDGSCAHLNTIHSPDSGSAEKLFTPRLNSGCCGLRSASRSETLVFRFDPAKVPFLGVWINEGGSPAGAAQKDLTVALEPCLAPFDSLEEAFAENSARQILPAAKDDWSFEVTVEPISEEHA